ncbi:hypothetical protein Z042_19090 [Chania multitudinisentens RB-25]|uniref:Uncharacterized protein n=1 Tax=Chania multitudinisentens RB-25 TaxID=1441930 RepID=W0LKS5_9GAMM|nr:hypothetical protein Z042_19090 [Chania multitudinisentens RB-25]
MHEIAANNAVTSREKGRFILLHLFRRRLANFGIYVKKQRILLFLYQISNFEYNSLDIGDL